MDTAKDTSIVLLQNLSMKIHPSQDKLEVHLFRFDIALGKLKTSGKMRRGNDIICHLLLTMPKTYNAVGKAFETTITEELTLPFIKGRIIDVESKQGTTQ